MVIQEPGPPPHAYHRLLTTARMEHAWWARNLTAPYPHTTADTQTNQEPGRTNGHTAAY